MENISQLEEKAINSALNQDWKKAIFYNKQILKIDKENLDACLRLAFALMQTGDYEKAKKFYKKALKIQPHHPTAIENLNRINIILSKSQNKTLTKEVNLDPNLFLEIPGKTKTVSLVNLGQKDILAKLSIGEKVTFRIRKRRVEIRTLNGEYIGHLPDDLSRRLQILIKAGSKFIAYIKEASFNKVIVFIKEEKRGKKVLKYLPFQISKTIDFEKRIKKDLEEIEDSEEIEEDKELTEADLEELAEELINEEKLEDYLTFQPPVSEDEEEE